MDKPVASRNRAGQSLRVLYPLLLWLLLVLVLYGIHTVTNLLAQTRVFYSVSLNGHPLPYPIKVTLDNIPLGNGDNVLPGKARFEITGPQTDPFVTNFTIWLGRHDLGEIRLKRSTGTLSLKANPAAQEIDVYGPEFSTNLTDSTGENLTVPTGNYTVSARYPHWSQSHTVSIDRNTTSPAVFSPQLGAVRLTCNKDGATYRVESNGQSVDSGKVPATVTDLPIGNYQVAIEYHNRQMQSSMSIEAGVTNEVPAQFVLGAAQLDTVPSGAQVYTANGHYLGQTPLLLPDIIPQKVQFSFSLAGYQPVSVALEITADQTNSYSTNLISVNYVASLQAAKGYLAQSNYEAAVQAATAALNAKPNDADALALQNDASEYLKAEQERQDMLVRPKRVFDHLCASYENAGQFRDYELKTAKPAKNVAASIVTALSGGLVPFRILSNTSPEAQTYAVAAQQTLSLGLGEYDCLLVVGQAKDDETQVWFKVLQYQIHHTIDVTGHLGLQDNKELIPVTPDLQPVVTRIRQGIEQATYAAN